MACGGDGCYGEPKHKECYPIPIPENEDFKKFAALKCLPFVRSEGVPDLQCSAGYSSFDLERRNFPVIFHILTLKS